ncbi:hypothetical protein B5P41_35720, partial [Bacillus sp. SRB_28]
RGAGGPRDWRTQEYGAGNPPAGAVPRSLRRRAGEEPPAGAVGRHDPGSVYLLRARDYVSSWHGAGAG